MRANFYSVEDNFLDTMIQKYYIINEVNKDYAAAKAAEGKDQVRLTDGKINLIDALYTDYNQAGVWNDSDTFNLANSKKNNNQTFQQINIIIPEGYRDVGSLDTSKVARMCVGGCDTIYQAKIIGMVTKMPGWIMTAYQSAQFFGQQLLSEKQYMQLLKDFM